MAVSPALGRSP